MSDKTSPNKSPSKSELARQERLSAALRVNLKRRKEQAKQQLRDRNKQAESEKPSASSPPDRSE